MKLSTCVVQFELYNYDNGDKLTSITSGGTTVQSFGYDAAGRTTSITTSSGTTTLSYDYESRLTSITYPGGGSSSYVYNGLDTRVGKTNSSGSNTYLRDGASVTAPVLSDGSATYTPGISESRSGVSTFYGHDRLDSNNLQETSASTVAFQASYDAFGLVKSSSGSTNSPFGFVGQAGYQTDNDSGLMLLGHRYYDPEIGRFLTRDPIKDGNNWYDYVANNPLRKIDPLGLLTILQIGTWIDNNLLGGAVGNAGTSFGNWQAGAGSGWQAAGDGGKAILGIVGLALAIAEGGLGDGLVDSGGLGDEGAGNPGAWDGQRPSQTPPDWIEKPSSSGDGTIYQDSDNSHNNFRIDPNGADGAPGENHVHVNNGGRPVGSGGSDLSGTPGSEPGRHIPYSEWRNWKNWNSPW